MPKDYRLGVRLWRWRNLLVPGALALAVVAGQLKVESIGTRLQYALPIVGFGCALATGGGADYALRFIALEAAVQGSKTALGETALNQRPNGAFRGFPSGHTAAASFGAGAIVHDCLLHNPAVKATAVVAAGFVGTSRIKAGKHDIWQVLAGVLYGYGIERMLRPGARLRRRLKRFTPARWR